jgi:trigger factor
VEEDTLKVTTERLPNCEVKLTVEMDAQRVNNAMRRAARGLARDVKIPGFRSGKAPFKVILRRFGQEALMDEVLGAEGQSWYDQALEEVELEPFGQAGLEVSSYEPLVLTFTLPVEPVVELGNYRDIRLDWEPPQVTDEEVEEELERLRRENARLRSVDRPIQLEDVVTMDVAGRLDGELIVDMEERPITLNPEISYPVPGFAEKVVGMTVGDDREFSITYPQDHANAAWAGREATFRVHLHAVKAWEAPELSDELARDAGDVESLDEWRAAVRQELEEAAQQQAEHDYANDAVGALAEQSQIEYPAVMVERELDGMMQEMDQSLRQRGLGLENFLVMTGRSEDEYRDSMRETAEDRVRRGLALGKLVEAEGLEVSEEEIDAEIERMAEGLGDEAEKFREFLATDEMRDSVRNRLVSQAAVDLLTEIARGEYTPPEAEDIDDESADTENTTDEPEEAEG